jgi:peroxiredoxin
MHKAFLPAVVALALSIGACSRTSPPSAAAAPSSSTPAPAWTLKDVNGKTVSLSDFKGKVVILDFWATWCQPCLAEIPHFIELQNEFRDKGVTIVGLSVDSLIPSDVAKFASENGINYPIVMADEKTATAYGADQGVPTTIVIDRKGNVVAIHLGITDKETFRGDIEKALSD